MCVKDEQKSSKKIEVIIFEGVLFFLRGHAFGPFWAAGDDETAAGAVQLLLIVLNALEGMRCFDAALAAGPLAPFQN